MSKRGPRQTSKALLPCEIREAEAEVVRSCQREAFPGEYKALVTGKPIPTKSPLMKLNPVLHEEGCIRSNGRLQFAEYLPYDVRFPMILPRGHCVTTLSSAEVQESFKSLLYQSAVPSVPQAQSRMDRSGGEPLPDVCRFLVHPCRFLVHRWISRLWLNLTA